MAWILIMNTLRLLVTLGCVISLMSSSEAVADDALPVPRLKRIAEKSGFHRLIVSELFLPVPDQFCPNACNMVLIESIPSGMYLDLDELGAKVKSSKPFNIEKPEQASSAVDVYVFGELRKIEGGLSGAIQLPAHLRYHRPSATASFAIVSLHNPKVLVRCPDGVVGIPNLGVKRKAPCDGLSEGLCVWSEVRLYEVPPTLTFDVPVGREDDYDVIIIGTLVLTFVGMGVVIFIIFRRIGGSPGLR